GTPCGFQTGGAPVARQEFDLLDRLGKPGTRGALCKLSPATGFRTCRVRRQTVTIRASHTGKLGKTQWAETQSSVLPRAESLPLSFCSSSVSRLAGNRPTAACSEP